ncbi:hypothetical protein ACFLZ5_00735 [Thermodesulfobacteriota bacterium]
MKYPFIVLLLISVCLAGPILNAKTAEAEFIDTMEFVLHSGFRLDQIDWNIAGYAPVSQGGQYVNVLSELDWKDIEIWQIGVSGKVSIGNNTASYNTYIRSSLDYGWISDGTVRDSDYNSNNRTDEYSRSISATEDDDMLDFSIGLGFEKKYWQDRLTLGFLGGYSYHEQNLRLTNGVQVIPDAGPFAGLNSTYASKWQGPFAGIDLELHPSPRFSLLGSIEYHWSDYEAEADWNLKTNWAHPVSFRHDTDEADGLIATLRGNYLFNKDWSLDLILVYRDFSAKEGLVRTFLAGGTTVITKFNEANWQSSAFTLGFTYNFR